MSDLDREQRDIERLACDQLHQCGFAPDAITVEWVDEFQDFVVWLEGIAEAISEVQLSCLAEVAVRTELDFQFKDRTLHRSFMIQREEALERAYPMNRGRDQPFEGNAAYPHEERDV